MAGPPFFTVSFASKKTSHPTTIQMIKSKSYKLSSLKAKSTSMWSISTKEHLCTMPVRKNSFSLFCTFSKKKDFTMLKMLKGIRLLRYV
jgi:hypothetical protein